MLRHLYRCLLRLHPPGFRKRFAEEMLSIFDQSRGKRAAAGLLADGLMSLTRQWVLRSESWNEFSPAPNPARDTIPAFHTLEPFRPRTEAVIQGLALSIIIFGMTCIAIKYSWIRVLHVRIPEVQVDSPQSIPANAGIPPNASYEKRTVPPAPTGKATGFPSTTPRSVGNVPAPAPAVPLTTKSGIAQPPASAGPQAQVSSGPQATAKISRQTRPVRVAVQSPTSSDLTSNPSPLADHSGLLQPEAQLVRDHTHTTVRAKVADMNLDAAERRRVIEGSIANLTKYYVDPDVAQRVADALLTHEQHGDDDAATDGQAFADLLTAQMNDVSHDPELMMVYSLVTTPEIPPAPTAVDVARYRKAMAESNCTFEKISMLPHNIGYLKFNGFPDASVCGKTAKAAMASLNGASAIIFDLRDNLGGYSNMVALIATYLFDRPTHLNDFYDRGENLTEESWTLPPVLGNKLVDKPVFVLTSATTFSAAEGFSYDLKMLKRATLVGENTSGRGHIGMGHRIDDHFTIHIPGMKVINPISKPNWGRIGVEPDVKVKAADALITAQKLAVTSGQRR